MTAWDKLKLIPQNGAGTLAHFHIFLLWRAR
jgi:hypothetical protein